MTYRRAKFIVYRDLAGEWRWKVVAANGRIVADSAESYQRQRDCRRAMRIVGDAQWPRSTTKSGE